MQLSDVVLSSLRRQWSRKLMVAVGLAVGVATVVALVAITSTMRSDIATKLDEYGANILIVPRADDLSLSYGGVTVATAAYDVGELSIEDLEQIQTIKNARNVSVVAPKLLGAVPLRDRTVLVAGVRFSDELRLKQWWTITGSQPIHPQDAVLGARLAEVLQFDIGDTFHINDRQFTVSGILSENGSQDDDIAFIDLATSQKVMEKPSSVSLVEVAALCTECPIEDMVEQIAAVLPQTRVTALRQAVTLRMETVGQLSRFTVIVSIVVAVIGGLVVLTTMLGAVSERRNEIGLFRALGFRQRHVMSVILGEAALMSLGSGILGWLAGMIAAVILTPRVAEVSANVTWSPWLAAASVSGALLVGLLSCLYPARTAAHLDPSVALRAL